MNLIFGATNSTAGGTNCWHHGADVLSGTKRNPVRMLEEFHELWNKAVARAEWWI